MFSNFSNFLKNCFKKEPKKLDIGSVVRTVLRLDNEKRLNKNEEFQELMKDEIFRDKLYQDIYDVKKTLHSKSGFSAFCASNQISYLIEEVIRDVKLYEMLAKFCDILMWIPVEFKTKELCQRYVDHSLIAVIYVPEEITVEERLDMIVQSFKKDKRKIDSMVCQLVWSCDGCECIERKGIAIKKILEIGENFLGKDWYKKTKWCPIQWK
jgi:hypothetical protein